MLQAALVTSGDELDQIYQLNQQNLKQHLSPEEKEREGFVTWLYSPELLLQMHRLAPSVVVKDGNTVVGYALVTLPEASAFHPDLHTMFQNLQSLEYNDKPLFSYAFYCMGQICIAKPYRGRGVFQLLYQKHRDLYSTRFGLLVTEISTANIRSQKAHEKVGFRTIHTYRDALDEWNVVVWDWRTAP